MIMDAASHSLFPLELVMLFQENIPTTKHVHCFALFDLDYTRSSGKSQSSFSHSFTSFISVRFVDTLDIYISWYLPN